MAAGSSMVAGLCPGLLTSWWNRKQTEVRLWGWALKSQVPAPSDFLSQQGSSSYKCSELPGTALGGGDEVFKHLNLQGVLYIQIVTNSENTTVHHIQ